LGLVLASTMLSSKAATIDSRGTNAKGVNIVSVDGTIEPGDDDRFDEIVAPLSGSTVVILRSPGGKVGAGLSIGTAIRRKGFGTAVPDDAICASICGIIWLAGEPRVLFANSKIGFHAAYREGGQESGQANAVIGAYLSKLGLSYAAIAYMTDAAPDDMHWLNQNDAEKYGIAYSLLNAPAPKAEPRPFAAQQPAPQQPPALPASTVEQEATRLVMLYYANWSQGSVVNLAQYYADTVSYYGGNLPRAKVMDEKRKFSERWPVRRYTVNPSSLFVECNGSTCAVTGVVAWDCTSTERGEHSVGTANFALRLVNGVIVSENGSVLTGRKETAESQAASTTEAYAQGRQARIEYEQWFAALPDGSYREGAVFWASHRSDKPPPTTCVVSPIAEWVAGCMDARTRLAPSDYRRRADKTFWWGWNSI
jgi:hypothetical protein